MIERRNQGSWARAKMVALAGFAALLSTSVGIAAPRTIVGEWKIVGQECTPTAGAISVSALGLGGDEMGCTFGSVSRAGADRDLEGNLQHFGRRVASERSLRVRTLADVFTYPTTASRTPTGRTSAAAADESINAKMDNRRSPRIPSR